MLQKNPAKAIWSSRHIPFPVVHRLVPAVLWACFSATLAPLLLFTSRSSVLSLSSAGLFSLLWTRKTPAKLITSSLKSALKWLSIADSIKRDFRKKYQKINQSIDRPITLSANNKTNQSINQSNADSCDNGIINKSINQPVNRRKVSMATYSGTARSPSAAREGPSPTRGTAVTAGLLAAISALTLALAALDVLAALLAFWLAATVAASATAASPVTTASATAGRPVALITAVLLLQFAHKKDVKTSHRIQTQKKLKMKFICSNSLPKLFTLPVWFYKLTSTQPCWPPSPW